MIKKSIEVANQFWPIISGVATCTLVVFTGVYAAGKDIERFSGELKATKGVVGEVREKVVNIGKEVVPVVHANTASAAKTDTEVAALKETQNQAREDLKKVAKEVQQVREEISAMKTQQKSDADWIKDALKRIEARQ